MKSKIYKLNNHYNNNKWDYEHNENYNALLWIIIKLK